MHKISSVLNRWIPHSILLALLCCAQITSAASPPADCNQAAIIVGTNSGVYASGRATQPLSFAEDNAKELHDRLVRYAQFDRDCTRLLLGPDANDVLDAVRDFDRLGRSGQLRLLALFFTGHANGRQLLLRDRPLSMDVVRETIRSVNADVELIWLDACNAGGLPHNSTVRAQGLTPGFNPIADVADIEADRANATVWILSSAADELSYEDPDLKGGIFSRYFINGFVEARPDNQVVDLRDLWSFASERTQEHARRLGLRQRPRMLVLGRLSDPIQFVQRGAGLGRLSIGPSIGGHLLLRSANGTIEEHFFKRLGSSSQIPVPAGLVEISRLPSTAAGQSADSIEWMRTNTRWTVDIEPGTTVRINGLDERSKQGYSSPSPPAVLAADQGACRLVRATPTRDLRWSQSGAPDLDRRILGQRIRAYRIRWSAGWSLWYEPGLNDIDWKANANEQGIRRVWTYFYDHDHEYITCSDSRPGDE